MQDEILGAARQLIDAFARHDRDAYFSAFAPEATFIFHNLDRTLKSRAEYEAEWALWESRDGFRVRGCRSSEQQLQMVGETGIFTHAVSTDVAFGDDEVTTQERETIVFARNGAGEWKAVHEHLSAPTTPPA
ncbi:nuclear transport factor 2 family protein [Rhizobium sp. LjRoot30]|uniref:YybH family protein n=1 Tax=Rhizobium sp. LjRoot30 TaxID=3342320 RepID=UPI003ECD54EC